MLSLYMYTIQPHRLTFGGIARRSPLGRVRSLLSSSTEFRFSTHSGSTSPSNIIHYKNTQNQKQKDNIIKIHSTESFCTSFISRLAYMHCSIKSISVLCIKSRLNFGDFQRKQLTIQLQKHGNTYSQRVSLATFKLLPNLLYLVCTGIFAFKVCKTYRKTAPQNAIFGFDFIYIYHVFGF